jgi:hypothetical protein
MTTALTRYDVMAAAIADCHTVDDCKELADRASAAAEYCKQLCDFETERRFKEIKLRAYRALGTLCNGVVTPAGLTKKARFGVIREHLNIRPDVTYTMIDASMYAAMMPVADFELALSEDTIPALNALVYMHKCQALTRAQKEVADDTLSVGLDDDINDNATPDNAYTDGSFDTYGIIEDIDRRKTWKEWMLWASNKDHKRMRSDYRLHISRKYRIVTIQMLLLREQRERLKGAARDNDITLRELIRQALDMWMVADKRRPLFRIARQEAAE